MLVACCQSGRHRAYHRQIAAPYTDVPNTAAGEWLNARTPSLLNLPNTHTHTHTHTHKRTREDTNAAGSSYNVAAPQGMVWSQILADNVVLSAVGIATVIAPNMLGSLAVGFAADWRAGAVPPIMLFALMVKEAHAPERWFRAGKFDHSLFHSHSLWHLLVWLVQTLYLLVYLSNFDQNDRAARQQQPQHQLQYE